MNKDQKKELELCKEKIFNIIDEEKISMTVGVTALCDIIVRTAAEVMNKKQFVEMLKKLELLFDAIKKTKPDSPTQD